ncbi:outer membrane lipoprotein [Acidocella aminolytica]|uniref:outer membrane lipoprotein n=1 Tax=Acidocella aminolytica TaxID=33998 RepID=UPI001114E64A|nr:hypothetical protein [Acidocella aminolytica]
MARFSQATDLALHRPALPFFLLPGLLMLPLTGCHAGYSPNTYAADAAQQEAPVQRGVIIGVRQVLISASGSVGATAGAAAGGIAGAQLPTTALGAVGGALVGTIGGAAAEKAVADTKGWEYIVQQSNNSLVSVTQTSKTALPIGMHVLVIDGSKQARIIPDYTVQLPAKPAAKAKTATQGVVATPAVTVSTLPAPAAPTPQNASPAATPPASTKETAAPAQAAPSAATTPKQNAPTLPADVTNDPILVQPAQPASASPAAAPPQSAGAQ